MRLTRVDKWTLARVCYRVMPVVSKCQISQIGGFLTVSMTAGLRIGPSQSFWVLKFVPIVFVETRVSRQTADRVPDATRMMPSAENFPQM